MSLSSNSSLTQTFCALLPVGWTTFLPILVLLGWMFRSRLIGQHLLDASRGLATLTLEVTALIVAYAGLRALSVYQV